ATQTSQVQSGRVGAGEFLLAKNFVRQTWVRGFDDKGRPQVIPGNDPTPEGNDQIFPGVDGAANWMSPSYSPLTKLFYVFARDERRMFTKNTVRHAAEENNASPTAVGGAGGGGRSAATGNAPAGNGIFGAGGN